VRNRAETPDIAGPLLPAICIPDIYSHNTCCARWNIASEPFSLYWGAARFHKKTAGEFVPLETRRSIRAVGDCSEAALGCGLTKFSRALRHLIFYTVFYKGCKQGFAIQLCFPRVRMEPQLNKGFR